MRVGSHDAAATAVRRSEPSCEDASSAFLADDLVPAWLAWLACAAIVAAAVAIGLATRDAGLLGDALDRGVYARYAQRVGAVGLGGFRELVHEVSRAAESGALAVSPGPAYVGASALWLVAFGEHAGSLVTFSIACHAATIALSFVFARRFVGTFRATCLAALIAFSPLLLGLSRFPSGDAFVTATLCFAIWCFLDLLREPRVAALATSALALAIAWTASAASIVVAVPLAAAAIHRRRRIEVPIGWLAVALGAPALIAFGAYAFAAGEASTFASALAALVDPPSLERYARFAGSGPWYRYWIDFLLLSPWTTIAACLALGVVVHRVRDARASLETVAMACVVVGFLIAFAFTTKNVRQLAILELPLRLLALAFLVELVGARGRRAQTAVVAGSVVLACALDYRAFGALFVASRSADPVTPALLMLLDVVPTAR